MQSCCLPSVKRYRLDRCLIVVQVYKALRGGVQDVAVKVLLATDEEQLLQFEKVRPGAFSSRTRSLVVKPP